MFSENEDSQDEGYFKAYKPLQIFEKLNKLDSEQDDKKFEENKFSKKQSNHLSVKAISNQKDLNEKLQQQNLPPKEKSKEIKQSNQAPLITQSKIDRKEKKSNKERKL